MRSHNVKSAIEYNKNHNPYINRMYCVIMCITLIMLVSVCVAFDRFEKYFTAIAQPSDEDISFSLFMNNYIVNEINSTQSIIKENLGKTEPMPTECLIVWSPIRSERKGIEKSIDYITCLDTLHAYNVWLFKDDKLMVQNDKQRAIEGYRANYLSFDAFHHIPADLFYRYYEFGIISKTDQEIKVYFIDTGGGLDGRGAVLTFERGDDGKWRKTYYKGIWMS